MRFFFCESFKRSLKTSPQHEYFFTMILACKGNVQTAYVGIVPPLVYIQCNERYTGHYSCTHLHFTTKQLNITCISHVLMKRYEVALALEPKKTVDRPN